MSAPRAPRLLVTRLLALVAAAAGALAPTLAGALFAPSPISSASFADEPIPIPPPGPSPGSGPGAPQSAPPDAVPTEPGSGSAPLAGGVDVGSMHNVHAITPRIARGSAPDTEQDFAILYKMGVKVIVSVDGARPKVELARKFGMRYVHVPIGYGGLT